MSLPVNRSYIYSRWIVCKISSRHNFIGCFIFAGNFLAKIFSTEALTVGHAIYRNILVSFIPHRVFRYIFTQRDSCSRHLLALTNTKLFISALPPVQPFPCQSVPAMPSGSPKSQMLADTPPEHTRPFYTC